MRLRLDLDRATLLHGAAISLSGAVAALLIAMRTHAQAPLCGLAHCPACYVAAALAVFGLGLAALSWRVRATAVAVAIPRT
jgi:hypothetical protein